MAKCEGVRVRVVVSPSRLCLCQARVEGGVRKPLYGPFLGVLCVAPVSPVASRAFFRRVSRRLLARRPRRSPSCARLCTAWRGFMGSRHMLSCYRLATPRWCCSAPVMHLLVVRDSAQFLENSRLIHNCQCDNPSLRSYFCRHPRVVWRSVAVMTLIYELGNACVCETCPLPLS